MLLKIENWRLKIGFPKIKNNKWHHKNRKQNFSKHQTQETQSVSKNKGPAHIYNYNNLPQPQNARLQPQM